MKLIIFIVPTYTIIIIWYNGFQNAVNSIPHKVVLGLKNRTLERWIKHWIFIIFYRRKIIVQLSKININNKHISLISRSH